MYKIDELITEIYADETLDIPGEFSTEQKGKIETKVLENINRRKSFSYRKRSVVLLVATLVLTLGLTVFAAKKNEWDIALIQFMGLSESEQLQLEGGEVVINKRTTSTWVDYAQNPGGEEKEISITEITSIGDRNSAYLKVSTDYKIPESFDEKTDYILPENNKIDISYKNVFGHNETRTFASVFTAIYEDGKLGFLVSIENCEGLNKCNVEMEIENLYWYHDLGKDEEPDDALPESLLAEGIWQTKWTYTYKSNVKTYYKIKQFDTEEGEIFLSKIEISPISIRMEAIRNPKDRELPWTINMLEEIQYEDGSKVEIKSMSSGGIGNGIFIEEFTNAYYFGEVLQPDKIKCVKVCGQNVDI